MPEITFRTARGTSLTARVSDVSILFLYRGREIANLPRTAISARNGTHLSPNKDPAFYIDPSTCQTLLAL